MRDRRALVFGLCMFAATGCASPEGRSIHLAAERAPRGIKWPFITRTPAADHRESGRKQTTDESAGNRVSASGSAEVRMERFLAKLDPETRELAQRELADVQPEEARQRLLTYLSTVEPERVRSLLESRRRGLPLAKGPTSPGTEAFNSAATVGEATGETVVDAAVISDDNWASAPESALGIESTSTVLPVAATVSASSPPAASPVTLTTVEPEGPGPVNPLRNPPAARRQGEEPQAEAATSDSSSSVSALAKLRQFDPRKTLSFGRENVPAPEAAEPARGALSKIASRVMHTEPAATVAAPAVAAPVAAPRSDLNATYLQEELQRLISLMEAEAGRLQPGSTFDEREAYLRRQAELRMLYLMAGQPQQAQQAIAGVDADTQEFWTRTMWGLSSYFESESLSDPTERATRALEQLQVALQHLRSAARLEVVNMAFCDKIDGYGVYHTFDQDIFRAGQLVLLYAEVRNFKSTAGVDNLYRTRLRSTIEILRGGSNGERVESWALEATEDLSRSPRTDHFHSYKLDLPADLAAGAYSVRLTLEDELCGKIASTTIDFLVR